MKPSNRKKQIRLALPTILFFGILAISIAVTGQQYFFGSKAAIQNEMTSWVEEESLQSANTTPPLKWERLSKKSSTNSFVRETGSWEGYSFSIVSQEAFSKNFHSPYGNGATAIEPLRNGDVAIATEQGFAIKNKNDTTWSNLDLYQVTTSTAYFFSIIAETINTSGPTSLRGDIYFGSYDMYGDNDVVVRLRKNNTIESVPNPFEPDNILDSVHLIPYWNYDAIVAYPDENPIYAYFITPNSVRRWSTPSKMCGSSAHHDEIRSIFTDTQSNTTYGILEEIQSFGSGCIARTKIFLIALDFPTSQSGQLNVTKIAEIENFPVITTPVKLVGTISSSASHTDFYKLVVVDLYGHKICSIKPKADSIALKTTCYSSSDPMISYNFEIFDPMFPVTANSQTDVNQAVHVFSAKMHLYLNKNFDGATNPGEFIEQTDRTYLANPYVNMISHAEDGTVYMSHKYLRTQFNKSLITIIKKIDSTE